MVLEGKFKHANPRENRFVGAMAWPCLVLHEGIETKTLALKVGRGISVDRAARLRPDEMLTVVGQVAKVTVMRGGVEEKGSDSPEPDVRITLRDLHAE